MKDGQPDGGRVVERDACCQRQMYDGIKRAHHGKRADDAAVEMGFPMRRGNVLPCALAMMPKNRVETSMRQKTSSPLEKPKCVEAALTERFMTVKLSAAITTHAEPSGSFLTVSI